MASFLQQLLLSLLFLHHLHLLSTSSTASKEVPKSYIVYMGSTTSSFETVDAETAEQAYLQLLSSVIPSEEGERISVIHSYHHAFKGFSALLTDKEASTLSAQEEVVSVFPDRVLQLHTTRSWDFLAAESGIRSGPHQLPHLSNDVIIGMIDTGIWPESSSFNDEGMGEIPSRWKGVCMEGSDFKKSYCNRKLIGARYYDMARPLSSQLNKTRYSARRHKDSPRDRVGHGTHTASIAAGAAVPNASYHGLARGTARGGWAGARIACYKACSEEGCLGSTILKAIHDAIKDGVDIISISIGMNLVFQSGFLHDPIAVGAFHAEQMRVMVVCSGGNDGPDPYTVVNSAPWIFTVAASNVDRDFQSAVLLGNGKVFRGSAINLSNLTRSERYPLAFGEDVAANFTPASEARSCYPGSLDPNKVADKIVVCADDNPTVSRQIKKLVVEGANGKGMILVDEDEKGVPFDSEVFPFAEVGNTLGHQILHYISSAKNPTATILRAVEVARVRPAPVVAHFSSRGPGDLTESILKPDIMAPGVAILAAMIPENGSKGKRPPSSGFAIKSGTSMACPHVTGAAALVKSVHPRWSSSMIRSALMSTATTSNNMGKPLTDSFGMLATPHATGVGEVNPLRALNPGLVFEATTTDYLHFLCYCGYEEKSIRAMTSSNFNCPKISSDELISNINYPSISIAKLDRRRPYSHSVKRTATNVGSPNSTYTAQVQAAAGLVVRVLPKKLVFGEGLRKASFKVFFYGKDAPKNYHFGSITWSDGLHSVRMVFAVNVE